jgi:hypothetical protein
MDLRTATLGCAVALFAALGGTAWGVTLHTGLISYWPLDDGPGATAVDSAPSGSVADNGTLRNAPTWISGKFNSGLQFDGVNQDVLIPNSTDMDINTDGVTVSAWVKLDQLPSEIATGFSGIYDSAPDNYVMYLDKGNNELRFKATNSGGASTPSGQHPGVKASLLNTSDWIHVMGVYDGVAGRSSIYFNGQLADSSAQSSGGAPLKGTVRAGQVASIGAQAAAADPFDATNLFKGSISDVAVWNRALGAAEAQYLYNGGTGRAVGASNPNIDPIPNTITPVLPTAQPIIYYKFNDSLANSGTGGSSLDAVVVGPNATAYSSAPFGNGLDLSSNPNNGATGVDSKDGTGNYLSVNYTLPDSGTIATRVQVQTLYNYVTLWSNSSNGNDWESWIYGDGRIAARADRGTPIVGRNIYDLDDPAASNHIAYTWERTGDSLLVRMYVNGEFVDERVGAWRDPGDTFFIGGGVSVDNTSNTYATGVFDEFRIYSSALSNAEVLYLSQNAPETVTPAFASDFDNNGRVDGADLALWKTGFGKATGATAGDGDADHDGDVDGADFLVWQRELGGGAATANAGAVPEPASALLTALAVAGSFAMHRRRALR